METTAIMRSETDLQRGEGAEAGSVGRPKAVRRVPPELRRGIPGYRSEMRLLPRLWRRAMDDMQFLRSSVQYTFALLCIWVGIEFARFVRWGLSSALMTAPVRPPGVEGFLPISALLSLKYWLLTGIVNTVHPSGLAILLAIAATGLFLKKAFCSWLCPVGTLSESLWRFGQHLFGRTFTPPRWADLPLRGVKYLLLAFFLSAVWSMDAEGLRAFIFSPYNKVADIKMYLFFEHLTSEAFWTIMILVLLSVFVKNAWCRYLCPYGAFLGALSWLSPLKVTRNASTCIDCELCTKACPASIKVHAAARVRTDECMNCYACVDVCPVKETLQVRLTRRSAAVPGWLFAVLVAGTFIGITGLAMLAGHWQNGISSAEYRSRMQQLDSPLYRHNRGQVPSYGPQD